MYGSEFLPGAVFHLQIDDEDADEKEQWRPHVLLTPLREETDLVTLAYCSTRDTQRALGAQNILVEKGSKLFRLTGFTKSTYIYPSQLIPAYRSHLANVLGKVIDDVDALLTVQLPRALGIGTGVFDPARSSSRSYRGVVAEMNADGNDLLGTPFAIVTTDPRYSCELEFLNVVPVYPSAVVPAIAPDIAFPDSHCWVREFGCGTVTAGIRFVQAVNYRESIRCFRPFMVDVHSMAKIDDALRLWFGDLAW